MTTNGTDPACPRCAELRAELADVTAERDEAGRTLGAAAAELARYEREVADLRETVDGCRRVIESQEAQIREAQRELWEQIYSDAKIVVANGHAYSRARAWARLWKRLAAMWRRESARDGALVGLASDVAKATSELTDRLQARLSIAVRALEEMRDTVSYYEGMQCRWCGAITARGDHRADCPHAIAREALEEIRKP